MYQSNQFDYYEDTQAQAIALPYGNGRLVMLVVLPKYGHTLDEVIDTLNKAGISKYTSGLVSTLVSISLPRMELSYSETINNDLKSLGISGAFDSKNADFSLLGVGPEYLTIVKHKVMLKVDEVGASTSNDTHGGLGGVTVPLPMNVNHPFFCAIYDSATNAVLFAGLIRNPQG
jgi:serpin B